MRKLLMAGVAAGALSLAFASGAWANPFSHSTNIGEFDLDGQNANEAVDSNIGQNNTWRLDATVTEQTVVGAQALSQAVSNNNIDTNPLAVTNEIFTAGIGMSLSDNAGVTNATANTGLQSNVASQSNIAAIANVHF